MIKKNKHIIIIGFMASGKSTIGKELSSKLNLPLKDTDIEIKNREGMEIDDIFKTKGEDYFREVEEQIFSQVLDQKEQNIVSTGGGIILSEKNRMRMEDHCVFLLDIPLEAIYNRVKSNKKRPLLNTDDDLMETISRIYYQRESIYHSVAHYTVKTANKLINQIVEEMAIYASTNCIKK